MGGDVLFTALERWQQDRPWGRFLDAGTGVNSLIWLQGLDTLSWDAITADMNMKREIQSHSEIRMRPQDSLLVGNWMDDKFCADLGKYDTILADYLIGAVDGFSPYTQDLIIERSRFRSVSLISLQTKGSSEPWGLLVYHRDESDPRHNNAPSQHRV
jgi:hypothetical protein